MLETIKRFLGFKNGNDHKVRAEKFEEDIEGIVQQSKKKKRCTEVDALEAENEVFRIARHEHETLQPFKISTEQLKQSFVKIKQKHDSSGNLEIAKG